MVGLRARWAWSGVLAASAVLAALASDCHGLASRRPFEPPPDLRGVSWATVGDAADAYRVWEAAGVRGRRLVVLTGRWSKPRNLKERPPAPEELAAGSGGGDIVDQDSALFAAAQSGIARRLDVVMPPSALDRRLAEVAGQKALERSGRAFRLPYEALERRFSAPEAFAAPSETVLVLVEPSWFQEGAPPDPAAWLAGLGARHDLALLALDDPAAGDEQRVRARRLGTVLGAQLLEVQR